MERSSNATAIDLELALRRFDQMLAIYDAAVARGPKRRRPPEEGGMVPAGPPDGPRHLEGGAAVDPDAPLT